MLTHTHCRCWTYHERTDAHTHTHSRAHTHAHTHTHKLQVLDAAGFVPPKAFDSRDASLIPSAAAAAAAASGVAAPAAAPATPCKAFEVQDQGRRAARGSPAASPMIVLF
jgi:hypothetical protein